MVTNEELESTSKEVTNDDLLNSIVTINKLFDNFVFSRLNSCKWNVCITVDRRGTAIFEEQIIRKKYHPILHVIKDEEIESNEELIKNNQIFILDDSIKSGKTIRGIINRVHKYNPKCCTVITIICPQNTLESLQRRYPNIEFCIADYVPSCKTEASFEIIYGRSLTKILWPYLQYTCRPIQNDSIHPYILIRSQKEHIEKLFCLLNQYGELRSDGVTNFIYENRCKQSFVLNEDVVENLSKSINKYFANTKIDRRSEILIRAFWRGDLEEIILQPMVRNYENYENISSEEKKILDQRDYIVKRCIIFDFLIGVVLRDLVMSSELTTIKGLFAHLNEKNIG